jgi:hypothetical protein
VPKGDAMRPLFKVIIAVFIILIALAVASQVRGEEAKLYHPDNHKETWTHLVNYLLTQDKWMDVHDNEMYHRGFAEGNESCTLAYNHTSGILTMTITKLADDDIRIHGRGDVTKIHRSKEITVLTMVTIDYDTVPDMAVMQQLDLNEHATKQLATTVVFNFIPQVKLGLLSKRLLKLKLNHMIEWALWEVHIMKTLGFKAVIPIPKEKI